MTGNDFNLKELKQQVKKLTIEHGLDGANENIKYNYKFYLQLRNTLLFFLYGECKKAEKYGYKFKNKVTLKNKDN